MTRAHEHRDTWQTRCGGIKCARRGPACLLRDGPAGPSLTVTRDTHVSDRALISAPPLRYDSPPPLSAGCDPARGSEELTKALRRASLGGARLSRAGRSIRAPRPSFAQHWPAARCPATCLGPGREPGPLQP